MHSFNIILMHAFGALFPKVALRMLGLYRPQARDFTTAQHKRQVLMLTTFMIILPIIRTDLDDADDYADHDRDGKYYQD